jgi:hypothetical protein
MEASPWEGSILVSQSALVLMGANITKRAILAPDLVFPVLPCDLSLL